MGQDWLLSSGISRIFECKLTQIQYLHFGIGTLFPHKKTHWVHDNTDVLLVIGNHLKNNLKHMKYLVMADQMHQIQDIWEHLKTIV